MTTDKLEEATREDRRRAILASTGMMLNHNFAGLLYDEHESGITLFVPDSTPEDVVRDATLAAHGHAGYGVAVNVTRVQPDDLPETFKPSAAAPVGSWFDSMRQIVSRHSARRIDPESGHLVPAHQRGGVFVDVFTASAVVAVHDKLSPQYQRQLVAMKMETAIGVCFKVLGNAQKTKT